MNRKNVGLLNAARIDALMRLNRRERGEAVAIDRGAFEIEPGRCFFHFIRELIFHLFTASR